MGKETLGARVKKDSGKGESDVVGTLRLEKTEDVR